MKRYFPFILTLLIIVADQITKALVVLHIAENTVLGEYFWGFIKIWHVRNDAVAFSFGSEFPIVFKYIMFILVPIIVMVWIVIVIISRKKGGEFSRFQSYLLAGIVGGGFGNIIDRIFRSLRVVDFISHKMYGILNMEWFPTYNIADMSVVVCSILLLLSFMFDKKEKK